LWSGIGWVRRMARDTDSYGRGDVQKQTGCLAHPLRSFPMDQNPLGMPETNSFSCPIFTSIFSKTRLHTNSLIPKYCFHALGLARASRVNLNWNRRTQKQAA
jgi:hypothetical protein